MTTPETSGLSPQGRLCRIALTARRLLLAGGLLFACNALCTWFFPDYAVRIAKSQVEVQVLAPLGSWARLAFVLWDVPSLAMILMTLYRLWQLFGEYLQLRVFGEDALSSLRSAARWILAAAVYSPIYRAGLSVIVSWQNGPGRRELTVNLGSDDYLMLVTGVVLLAISSVMVEAARIAKDNEGFV